MDNAFVHLQYLRNLLLPLPGVTEKLCYGTPGFYAGKKMFARIKEDGKTLVLATTHRDEWMEKDPQVYFITDHYRNYDYMLIALEQANPAEVEQLLIQSWMERANKKDLANFKGL